MWAVTGLLGFPVLVSTLVLASHGLEMSSMGECLAGVGNCDSDVKGDDEIRALMQTRLKKSRTVKGLREFEYFMKLHEKTYADEEDKMSRFQKFAANLRYIQSENRKSNLHKLGVNQFADLTQEEFATLLLKSRVVPEQEQLLQHDAAQELRGGANKDWSDLPMVVNWDTSDGGLAPVVKNQGNCKSAWAFVATDCHAAHQALRKNSLAELSAQQLLDCSTENDGCDGGQLDAAFKYMQQHALSSQKDYPYSGVAFRGGKVSKCLEQPRNLVNTTSALLQSYGKVYFDNMLGALMNGPLAAAVNAASREWQSYASGVLVDSCGGSLDHHVLIVGYSRSPGSTTYLVKNSWGKRWGESGYISLRRKPESSDFGPSCLFLDVYVPL